MELEEQKSNPSHEGEISTKLEDVELKELDINPSHGEQISMNLVTTEKEDRQRNPSREFAPFPKNLVVVLAACMCLSIVVIIVLTAIIFTRVERLPNEIIKRNTRSLRDRYPGYFRTPDEQKAFLQTLKKLESFEVNESIDLGNGTCTFECNNDNSTLPVLKHGLSQHACCVSMTMDSCDGCKCRMEVQVLPGVYDTGMDDPDDKYDVSAFAFPGCCRCMNTEELSSLR